jgi:hypothetical protein
MGTRDGPRLGPLAFSLPRGLFLAAGNNAMVSRWIEPYEGTVGILVSGLSHEAVSPVANSLVCQRQVGRLS